MLLIWGREIASALSGMAKRRYRAPTVRRRARVLHLEGLESRLVPATHTWTGAVNGSWSNSANWLQGSPAGDSQADLEFPPNTQNLTNKNDLPTLTIHSIDISGSNYTISGNQITLNAGITLSSGGQDQATLALDIKLGDAQTIAVANSKVTLDLTGIISGLSSASLTATGNGTLEFTAANDAMNTYAAGTILSAGSSVQVGADQALGTGMLTFLGGTLETVSKAADLPSFNLPNPFSVNGQAAIDDTYSLQFTGNGMLNAELDVNTGSDQEPNGGRFQTTSFSGSVGGAGSIKKDGLGYLQLEDLNGATNTYTGGTILNLGELELFNSSSLGSGTLTLNGGILEPPLGHNIQLTVNNSFIVNGTPKIGYNGNELSNVFDFTGPGTLNAGSTLTVENSVSTSFEGPLSGKGSLGSCPFCAQRQVAWSS